MKAHEQRKWAEAYLRARQQLSELQYKRARNLKPKRNARDFKG